MMEIRPIRSGEAESFLTLLCDVFDLDIVRARAIFFSEPLFDLERKWALFEGGSIASILTTVPLEFGWGRAIGVAGVATRERDRGRGLAGELLRKVTEISANAGEPAVLLFAKDTRLYERLGFSVIDTVVRGVIRSQPEPIVPAALPFESIRAIYDDWAADDANRLRRDELRWAYWRWNLRVCTAVDHGYLCYEGGVVREAIVDSPPHSWVLPLETEWIGLASMARMLGITLESAVVDLSLMAYETPGSPQLFLTDQF